jgi:hypothetical protein
MIGLLRHLLSPAYLYAQNTSPARDWSPGFFAWLLVMLGLTALAWWQMRRQVIAARVASAAHVASAAGRAGALTVAPQARPSLAARTAFVVGCAGIALLVLRQLVAGVWSARVWSLSALALTALGVACPMVARLRFAAEPGALARSLLRSLLRPLGRAAACQLTPDDPPLPLRWQVGLAALHVAGLAILGIYGAPSAWQLGARQAGAWPVVAALLCLLAVAWARRRAGRGWLPLPLEILTPLIPAYLVALVGGPIMGALGIKPGEYRVFHHPDPWSIWFDGSAVTTAGVIVMALSSLATIWRGGRRGALIGRLGMALLLLGAGWSLATAAAHRSYGVTASDPYCYAQMAIDLVERGTVQHEFPLAAIAQQEGLPTWPTVHIGYHPPSEGATTATVWPIGWSLLLAPFYALGGEVGVLWGAPLFALLAGLLTYWLVGALWPEGLAGEARLAGGLAALIVWTSHETILRTLVPMADSAAQAFVALTLLCLALARWKDRLLWSAAAGLALAAAYWVRHPLLPMVLAVLPLFALAPWPTRRKVYHLAAFGGVALVAAIPDLVYHAQAFGSPLTAESPEWFLMSWRNIWPEFQAILGSDILRRNEFGYLLPFILYGFWQSWRDAKDKGLPAMLTVGFLGTLLFALCYEALRLRDLIPLFPWLAVWAVYGVVGIWRRVRAWSAERVGARALALFMVVLALSARTADTLALPRLPSLWSFGYVTQASRGEYDRLAEALPPDAVVLTSLSSGSIELYTDRAAVRPASWTDDEWQRFVSAAHRQGHSLYLLADGEEMAQFMPRLAGVIELQPVGTYAVPTFGLGGNEIGQEAVLYALVVGD